MRSGRPRGLHFQCGTGYVQQRRLSEPEITLQRMLADGAPTDGCRIIHRQCGPKRCEINGCLAACKVTAPRKGASRRMWLRCRLRRSAWAGTKEGFAEERRRRQ